MEKPVEERQTKDRDREATKAERQAKFQSTEEKTTAQRQEKTNPKKRERTQNVTFTVTLGDSMYRISLGLIFKVPATETEATEPKGKRQKKAQHKVEDIADSLSSAGLKANVPSFQPTASKTRCAFFPSCTRADCPFFHPTEPCKYVNMPFKCDRIDCFLTVPSENCVGTCIQHANLEHDAVALIVRMTTHKKQR